MSTEEAPRAVADHAAEITQGSLRVNGRRVESWNVRCSRCGVVSGPFNYEEARVWKLGHDAAADASGRRRWARRR